MVITGTGLLASYWLALGRSSASPSADTLSAYYKLDEASAGTAADSSGDANPATVTGATASTDVPTTVFTNSRSLSFDGNDYAAAADAPELDPSNLTLSFWVKLNTTSGIQTMVAKWDITHWQQYVVQQDSGVLRFYTGDGSNVAADSILSSQALSAGVWYHIIASQTGTTRSLSVNEVGQAAVVDNDTAGQTVGSSAIELTMGAKKLNAGSYTEFLDGKLDDVRVYSRVLSGTEITALNGGDHTTATWTGASSTNYDLGSNWDTGAVPDPYTYVDIAGTSNQPALITDIGLAGLTIDSGARLNLAGKNLTMNDSGTFSNNGTLQLKNSETLTNFTNDTNSGTVLLTPDADITGLKTGNSYNNLIVNDGTYAHWNFDVNTNPVPDMSGFNRDISLQPGTSFSTTVPTVNYENNYSLDLNGSTGYATLPTTTLPNNATYCTWLKMDAGNGTVLGTSSANQYALKINGGTQVAVRNDADNETLTWTIANIYNNWHHLCLTQTDNTVSYSVSLYLDGTVVGSPQVFTHGMSGIDSLGSNNSTNFYDGKVDDLRIFSRTLTPTEIARFYAGIEPATYTSTQTLGANLDVNGNLYLASGRLDASTSNYQINIGGNFRNDGGVFNGRSGAVVLDGNDQAINSSMTFYDLAKSTATAHTLTFGQKSTTNVTHQLSLTGASGQLLSLRSSTSGTQWKLNSTGSETIDYLDVQDSNNIDTEPVDITNATFTNSGNNINWTVNVAPDTPTSLGPTQYINSSYGTDDTPTLTFSLADTNPVDLLRYRVQIDNNSDFSSPEVDYTSSLGAQGSRSLTVGQVDSDDTYTVGSDNMTMATGDYYWRVKAIDDYDTPNESSYATANSGSIAFKLDITGPTTPGTPTSSTAGSNRKPTWNWTGSTDANVGLASPIYTLQWSTDNTFGTGVNAATTSSLTFTHVTNLGDGQWYFRVRASDSLGNVSAWATSTSHLIDNTGPSTPVTPFTGTPTSINTPTWSWAAPTDAGIGLAATPYTLNWSQTSNFSSGVFSTTSATNVFTHSTALVDGTWYMRVKATDGLGNDSAWSSTGSVLIDGTSPSLPGAPQTTDPTNDDTPSWTWDASIDVGGGLAASNPYTVQWSDNPGFSPTAGSTASSTNSFTHSTPLADGTWYIRASARDVLGNQSGYSDTGEVTIDTVAPDKPSTPTVSTPTNDDTPTWSWTAPDDNAGGVGLSITPYTVEWSTTSDFSSGNYSDTTGSTSYTNGTSLAEGTWYFRLKATDKANNTSVYSDVTSVYIDTTAPTVPANTASITPVPDNTPTWTWDASSDGGIGMAATPYQVQWSTTSDFSSGNFTDTAASNTYTHSTPLADGTWYFRVRGVDAVGNQSSYSTYAQQTIDVGPPTTPGTPTTTTPTADNTPAWSWTASSDAGTGLDGTAPYTVEWSTASDFSSNAFSDTSATNTFTHGTTLADGTWYFRVKAQDAVNNFSSYSANGTVVVDVTAPTAPGTPATTTPTTDDTPTFNWSAATDSGVGLAATPYVVEWSTHSDFSTGVNSFSVASNSFTPSVGLTDGTWYFRVRAKDKVNNTSADSGTGSVYVDDTAPSIPGTPSTTTPTDNTTPTWTWSASTDNGIGLADPAYELQWSQDSGFSSGVSSDTINTESFTHGTTLADGTWYFRVRAVDDLSNTSSFSSAGSVIVSTAGPSVPGTPATTTPTSNNLPAWSWTASSSPAGLANPAYSVEWSQDNTFNTGVSSQTVNSATYTHVTPLADGTWYVRIKAEDQTGLYSAYSASGLVFVDTTGPSAPGTPATTNPTNDNTPTWSWTPSSDGSGVGLGSPAYTVEWSQDSGFSSGVNSQANASTSYTHSIALTEGTWYFRVIAKDSLNNVSSYSANGTVVVDTSGPSTPGTPSTTTPTADNTPSWTWTASSDPGGTGLGTPAYELQWSKDSTFSTGVNSGTSNSTSFTHGSGLSDGTWYFRLRADDAVGNHSGYSGLGTVVVDTTAPGVPGTPTTGGSATNDTTPAWTWTASTDAGTGLGSPAYTVEWSQDNTFGSGVSTAAPSAANYTHTVPLAEGTWYFRVKAKDAVNNQSSFSAFGTVLVDTDLPTAPGAPATSPSPTNDTTPTWTWTASSDTGAGFGATPYGVEWSEDAGFSTGVSTATSTSATYTHTAALTDGTWYFRVKSTDGAGNDSTYSSSGTVIIDATAPTTPGTPSTTTPTKDPLPAWTWTASSDTGVGLDNPAYELQWSLDAGFASGVQSDTVNTTSFTHTTPLADGFWHFRVRALDDLGNASAWASAVVSVDNTPPVASSISASVNSSGATITWATDEAASSQVHYSVGSALDLATTETDTSTRVTSHSVAVTGINPCVTIEYQVSGADSLDNLGQGAVKSFTTAGCAGNAQVATQSASDVTSAAGGSAGLASGTANIALAIPAGYAGHNAQFQVKQLVTSTAIAATGSPTGRSLVGNHLYDLKALTAPDTLITSFNNAITVAMTYGPTETNGFDVPSLAIFRWDGSGWQQLSDCTTNTVSRTTSCKTSGFSVFGLFGKAYVPVVLAPDPVVETPPDPEPVKTTVKTSKPDKTEVEAASSHRSIGTAISDTVKSVARRPGWIFGTLLFLSAVAVLGFLTYRRLKKDKPHYGIHKDD